MAVSFSRYSWGLDSGSVIGACPQPSVNLDNVVPMKVVTVRRGGSCDPFLIEVEAGRKCKVTGPPGCGKSSKYVSATAVEAKRLVVHLVPHPRLVDEFVARGYEGCEVLRDVSSLYVGPCVARKPTVLVTTYTNLLAQGIREGLTIRSLSCHPLYYCDEFHDSDAATYVVVKHFMSKTDRHSAVFVSATLDSSSLAPLEINDPIIDEVVPSVSSSAEYATAVQQALIKYPQCTGVLLYCDKECVDLRHVRLAVERTGYEWMVINSRSSREQFLQAKVTLDSNKKIVVCADSSYRSGFDFPAAMVIDSCRVSFRESNQPTRFRSRAAFGFELYQSRGRLGRVNLKYQAPLVHHKLLYQPSNDVAVVEGYEAIIAAHVIHALGGDLPLELSMIGISKTHGYLRDYRSLDSDTMITLDMLVHGRSVSPPIGSSFSTTPTSSVKAGFYADPLEMFAKLSIKPKTVFRVPERIGTMVHVAGPVDTRTVFTRTFPRGRESVEQCIEAGTGLNSLLHIMDMEDTKLAASVIFEKMNNLSCEYHAAGAFMQVLAFGNLERSPTQTRWLTDLHDSTGLKASEYAARARDLQLLADKSMIDVMTVPVQEFKDIISSLTTTLNMVYKSQASFFHQPVAIADRSRQNYLGGLSVNAGYDPMGRPLLVTQPRQNAQLLEVSGSIPTSRVRTARASDRPSVDNPDYTVTNYELQVHNPSIEHMRRIYPNAQFTASSSRQQYDARKSSRSSGGSSKGSWSLNGDGKRVAARTWRPPG